MARPDVSDQVIHFTRGSSAEEAFASLKTILADGRLLGGTGSIRGGYRCVCFTEAPLESLPNGFVNSNAYSRYSRFGIMVDKSWLYAKGGRPVIYQPEQEYDELPEALRWRHVRYEPNADPPIDFAWEREWRIPADELTFTPNVVTIVVPDPEWCEALRAEHDAGQDLRVEELSTYFPSAMAEQHRELFPWLCVSLE